jgi:acyl-CoA thioester hydrolase
MSSDAGGGDRTQLRVRYAETDQMGRAHHMHYLAWFELGRTELLRGSGVAYSEIEREGIMLPVANVEIEYTGAAGYDELVDIQSWVSEVRSRTVTFSYRATLAGTGLSLATGRTRLVCTDSEGKARRIPPHLVSILASLVTTDPEERGA